MPTLKAYTLGVNGFVDASVLEALGEPGDKRQAGVLVFAHTKRGAIDTILGHRLTRATVAVPQMSDPEFRVASGPIARALLGSWVDEPAVVVTPLIGGSDTPVVRIGLDGEPEHWGVLRRVRGAITFVPRTWTAAR
jgi:hypothetical protein